MDQQWCVCGFCGHPAAKQMMSRPCCNRMSCHVAIHGKKACPGPGLIDGVGCPRAMDSVGAKGHCGICKKAHKAHVKQLQDARAVEQRYQRRKDAITFLQGSGYLPTAAQREVQKAEVAQMDKHAKLAAIDRSTTGANLEFLTGMVFENFGREIVKML